MGFASGYLAKRTLFEPFTLDTPHKDTWIIVVIPAFDEPNLFSTVESIAACDDPGCRVELIIVFNAPASAKDSQVEQNRNMIEELKSRGKRFERSFLRLFLFDAGRSDSREWGAGMARKTGMDEALRRFDLLGRFDGAIVSLDADCTVSGGYLVSIFNELCLNRKRNGCTIYFEHPLPQQEDHGPRDAIIQYELHLRYYYQALKLTGFPEVFHTVGSAMAIKAGAYMKAGGMNRRQAGEDFYFIQKLIPPGGLFYLTGATVYPSPRESARVPFGTGPAVSAMLKRKGSKYLSYDLNAFTDLAVLFANLAGIFRAGKGRHPVIGDLLPVPLTIFMNDINWVERMEEIKGNTSSEAAFKKRFFGWFNMFMIVKFLNWSHGEGHYEKTVAAEACRKLLALSGHEEIPPDDLDLLVMMRSLEKRSP